jgi:hydrogenase maturation factor
VSSNRIVPPLRDDEDGIPMRVVDFDPECGVATCVGADGVEGPVDVEPISPVRQGDVVLVSSGVGLVVLEEATR